MAYAEGTKVSVARTRAEIEELLVGKHGAKSFMAGYDNNTAVIGVAMKDRNLRFTLPMPNRDEKRFTHGGRHGWTRRTASSQAALYEQACRARWRALLLAIKAKLESVEAGIETFEEAFLANVILPDGSTVGAWLKPQLAAAYTTSKMPRNLLTGSDDIVEGEVR